MVAVDVERYVELKRMIDDLAIEAGNNRSIRVRQYDSFDFADYDHWAETNNKRALRPDCHYMEDEVALDPPHADRITRMVAVALQQEEEDNRRQLAKEVSHFTRQLALQQQQAGPPSKRARH